MNQHIDEWRGQAWLLKKLTHQKTVAKNFAVGCPTNDDPRFGRHFYPQNFSSFKKGGFSTPTGHCAQNPCSGHLECDGFFSIVRPRLAVSGSEGIIFQKMSQPPARILMFRSD
jgi:hypothetical protein